MIPSEEQAVWNRVAVVVFSNPVPKEKQDKQLAVNLLRDEAEGIIAWMIEGETSRRKNESGIGAAPEGFENEKAKWQKRMDAIQQFIDECCEKKDQEKPDALYKAYVEWIGNPDRALSRTSFTQKMAKRGVVLSRDRRHYVGVTLVKGPEKTSETDQSELFEGEKSP
jgi:putative DNA primase/helicase